MTLEQEVIHWKNMVKLYKYDYLTGMKQRQDFEKETTHKMQKQTFWIAMYDVTALHSVNREQGFAAGDALIKQVARDVQMIDSCWEAYRIGGDEFIGIYFDEPPVDIDNATGAAIYSEGFTTVACLVSAVDKLVIEKKISLDRRR